jgi:hypothetical protein
MGTLTRPGVRLPKDVRAGLAIVKSMTSVTNQTQLLQANLLVCSERLMEITNEEDVAYFCCPAGIHRRC